MDHIAAIITDPTVRAIVGPATGAGLTWAVGAVKRRFAGSPPSVQQKAEANAEAFAEIVAEKIAAKVQVDPAAREAINQELGTPKGAAALHRAVEVAAEVDDEFTRENLAELVTRRLTVGRASRLQLATRIATESLVYLTERQLRLLAFMISVQGLVPQAPPGSETEWTAAVIAWMRNYHPAVFVTPDARDLGLLASAGLVDVMPGILGFDLKESLKSPQGFVPQIDQFLANDTFGIQLKAAFDVVMRHRLNLSGIILGATVADKITGVVTDFSKL